MIRPGYVRRLRRMRLLALAVVPLAACSSANEPAAEPATGSTTTTTVPAAAAVASGDAEPSPRAQTLAPQEWTVEVEAAWSGIEGRSDGTSSATVVFDPSDASDGPFGAVGSCSGHRGRVGAYSVFASEDGTSAVSVWTADRVLAAGIYDAEVRVEGSGDPVVASGTMTVLDGLQDGEFLAFVPGGGRVEGSFRCAGAASPSPLDIGRPGDGELATVEVFAVLRHDGAERVVGLAADAGDDVVCPGAVGVESGVVVGATGDARLGAVTSFELADAARPALRMQVLGEAYEFTGVTVALSDDATSGSFAASSVTGVAVDGAFRCT